MRIAPGHNLTRRFRRIALAVKLRSEHPTDFRRILERLQTPPVVGKSNLAHEGAGRLFLNGPVAEAEPGPMTGVTQHSPPGLFSGKGLASDVARHRGVRPHGGARNEITRT